MTDVNKNEYDSDLKRYVTYGRAIVRLGCSCHNYYFFIK